MLIWIQVKSVGQIANSGALQSSSGKNYIFFILKCNFQQFYTKWSLETKFIN